MSGRTQEQLAAVLAGRITDDAALFTRVETTPAIKAEAARQWADIPDTPDAIRAWAKGEPINRENSDA
jgi:hypothetical protein